MSRMLSLDGFDNIRNLEVKLDNIARKYPDKMDELLRKDALELRKETAKFTRSNVNVNPSNKKSLGKAVNYKVGKVRGYGAGKEIDIMAKPPHFHLVEKGHELYIPAFPFDFAKNATKKKDNDKSKKKGKTAMIHVGRTREFKNLEYACEHHNDTISKNTEKIVNDLLRECGLI